MEISNSENLNAEVGVVELVVVVVVLLLHAFGSHETCTCGDEYILIKFIAHEHMNA